MGRPAVFLDRDGTIIREVDYLRSLEQLRLLPRAAEAIRRLNEAGLAVVVITNQSGVARGMLTERDLDRIHEALGGRLARRGARLDACYFCPHHPEFGASPYRRRCRCRKPQPGMLLRAARDLDLDLGRSFVVGDSERDLAAGRSAGCQAVLVRTGYGRGVAARLQEQSVAGPHGGDAEVATLGRVAPDHIADDLNAAVDWILGRARTARPKGRQGR